MKPDKEYTAERYCRLCRQRARVRIRVEEWIVVVSCLDCNGSYELDRY